jgi:DNA-binding beta-propeller fold protein YncE
MRRVADRSLLLCLAFMVPTARVEGPPRARGPVAMAVVDGGATLLVANRRAGTISVVDTKEGRVTAEWEVGRGLADLAVSGDGRKVLAVDQEANALIVLGRDGRAIGRVEVAADPVAVAISDDATRAAVASRSTRRLTLVDLAGLKVVGPVDLAFRPGRLVKLKGGLMVVADAFGGGLAVVDLDRGEVLSSITLPAHNIGGLAVSADGETLAIAHQTLNRLATTSFDDIHWGDLVTNRVRLLRVSALLSADPLEGGRLIELDAVGNAAADPAGIALGPNGEAVVAVAGVGQVAVGPGLGSKAAFPAKRVGVGARPTAVAIAPDGSLAYAAETLDDAIAVIGLPDGRQLRSISLGPRPDLDAAGRGERLFFDAKLSHDGWMSCHSCHTDGQTNGLPADTLGDGSYGAPKLTPSLLGVGSTGPWTWTGGVDRLEDQVRKSVETSMRGKPPIAGQVADLTAYLRTLRPPPPSPPAEGVERGAAVFRAEGCVECHKPPSFTSPGTFDVGLADEQGRRRFNPPSLLGVGHRSAFLHDGRSRSLDDVFRLEKHPRGLSLSDADRDALIAYLKSL